MTFLLFTLFIVLNCSQKANLNKDAKAIQVLQELTKYNLFSEVTLNSLTPTEKGIPYDLNTALFSDYAKKERVIFLPEGTQIQYEEEREFDFPIGTIITKTFYLPDDFERKDGKKTTKLETRILIRQPTEWFAVSYVWNSNGTQAHISYAGENIPIQVQRRDLDIKEFTYVVPSRNQCAQCHQSYEEKAQKIVPIGPKARHLNREYEYQTHEGKIIQNQLEYMKQKGVLVGLPFWNVPKLPKLEDQTASVESRARAYLDINCGHCHNEKGAAGMNSKLVLTHNEKDLGNLGVCKTPGSAGKGGGGLRFDIVPGEPNKSILFYRTATMDSGAMMPQIGRAIPHKEGIEILRKWIASMEKKNCE